MSDFLVQAKKEFWRSGRQLTEAYLQRVEALLLEKLGKLGEITEDDRLWAKEVVAATFSTETVHEQAELPTEETTT